MRAVIHTLHCKRQLAGFPSLIQQGCNLTKGKYRIQSPCKICIIPSISLFSDSECNHLKTFVLEYIYKTLPVCKLIIGLESLSNRCNHFLFNCSVALERYKKRKILIRRISLIYNFKVKCLCDNHTTVILTCVECIIEHCSRKSTEYISSSEVNPCRIIECLLADCGNIKLWKLITLCLPLSRIQSALKYICKFHNQSKKPGCLYLIPSSLSTVANIP